MSRLETLVTLIGFLALFGWIGHRRGTRAELITLGVILGSRIAVELWGDRLVAFVNRLHRFALFIVRGGVTAENPGEVWTRVSQAPPLISAELSSTFLLAFLVLLVVATYLLSYVKLFRGRSSWWSVLVGMFNGYLLNAFFLPILPRGLPGPLAALSAAAPPEREVQIGVASESLRAFLGQYRSVLWLGVIGLILYLIVRSIEPEKKKEG
ncbi:MAG: hypothetical protein RML36_15935 [Anaerolineae bacterium]|nr:hypothetical protein [Anaerolineae bacterium]MDW8100963.1 hypothetical protein [Anaerolineae bacterium]